MFVLGGPHKVAPIGVDDNGFASCNDKQKVLRAGNGDIHSPYIAQESNSLATGGTHARKNDNVGLPALEGIHSVDLDELLKVGTKMLRKHAS